MNAMKSMYNATRNVECAVVKSPTEDGSGKDCRQAIYDNEGKADVRGRGDRHRRCGRTACGARTANSGITIRHPRTGKRTDRQIGGVNRVYPPRGYEHGLAGAGGHLVHGPARRDDEVGKEYVLSIRRRPAPPGMAPPAPLLVAQSGVYLQIPGRRFAMK